MGARPRRVAAPDARRVERGDSSGSCARSTRPDGAPITSWRELTDLWIDIANDTLTETHRTPEFLEAQRRLTRSSTDCRLAGARDRRGLLRDAPHPDAHRSRRAAAHRLRAAARPARAAARGCAKRDAPRRAERRATRQARRATPSAERSNAMPFRLQLDPAQTVQEFAELSRPPRARRRAPALGEGPRRRDRDDAQEGSVPAGQDDALSLRRRSPRRR